MSESGGAKFLRLLQALIEATREGRIEWVPIEGEAARESTHDRIHPGDQFGPLSLQGAYTSVVGLGVEVVFRPKTPDYSVSCEVIVATVDHGSFGMIEAEKTTELFADLAFLITGGGDRQEALDAALEAVEGVKP